MELLERLELLLEDELIESNKNIGYLKNKYPQVRDLERYLAFDPTYEGGDLIGQFSEWIVLQVKKGNLKPTDKDKIHELLTDFQIQKKRKALEGNEGSILSYKTVEDLISTLDKAKERGISNSKKGNIRNVSAKPIGGTEIVYADNDWTIYIPYTWEGSKRAASVGGDRAAWCTANPSSDHYWDVYSNRGPLYIIIDNHDNTHKYQINISRGRLDGHMDRYDRPFNFEEFLSDKPEMKKFFDGEFNANPQEYFDKKNVALYKQLEEEKVYHGKMDLSNLHLSKLPDNFMVDGDLYIKDHKFSMPKNLTVTGKLVIGADTGITQLSDLTVEESLVLVRSEVTFIDENTVTVEKVIVTPDARGRFTNSDKFSNIHKFNKYMERK